jgi:hypothetical protein
MEARSTGTVVPVADKQILHAGQRLAIELAAGQHDGALPLLWIRGAGLSCLVVGEVHQSVAGELGVQSHFVQAAGSERRHLRQSSNGIGFYFGFRPSCTTNQPQPDASFADQRVAVGQKRQTERMRQAAGNDRDLQSMLLGRIEGIRAGGQRHGSNADLRLALLGNQRC